MAEKSYTIYLEGGFRIVVTVRLAQGRVVGFIVRLVDESQDSVKDLARYDTAHGWPHLDILNEQGQLKVKSWSKAASFDQAFQEAIEDFKKNHETYAFKRKDG
jgi:hypothetical protein